VGIVVALLIGGAAFVRGGDADESGAPSTTQPIPVGESGECDAPADAAALSIEAGLFDYDVSESPTDLAEDVDAVLTGQLLSARSGTGGLQASVAIKPGRIELGEGDPPNAFGLPVIDVGRVGQTTNFVAFLRVNPAAPGGYEVAVDGLWLACEDGDLAVPVFDHPAGWAEVNSIDSIVSSVRDVRRVGQPLEPTVVGDGTTVSRIALVDGTQFALTLPESFGTDLVLGQGETDSVHALVQGEEFEVSITVDFCPEDNLFPTERGLAATSLIGRAPAEGVVFCRPDEFITMRLNPTPPFGFSPDEFDVVPISFGDHYQAFLLELGVRFGQCCFEDLGPMWDERDMIVADGGLGGQVQRLDGDTLVPQWSIDLRDEVDSSEEWVGDGSYLAGIDESRTLIASTGFGFILGIDAATGERDWQIDLAGHSVDTFSRSRSGGWFAASDIVTEGGQTAPKLWHFNGASGQALWVAEGEPSTDLQWDRPTFVGDVVLIADVPSNSENRTGQETSHVLAFDEETGERRWTFDLESDVEGYIEGGAITALNLDDDPLLLASNVEGVLFRIDPATGSEIWRNENLPGSGPAVVVSVQSPFDFTVQRGSLITDVDAVTGEQRVG
jgi:outer membrane protein assembly factor BamB